MPLLEADEIVSGYVEEIDIIKGVSIYIEESEIVAIIGPNGSGKSTLLKTMAGVLKTRKGSIKFKGEDISNLSCHEVFKKGISYIQQDRSIFPDMTVLENLEMGGYTIKNDEVLTQKIEDQFDLFPILEERKNEKANLLSGGQQRTLELTRALITEPECLFLDEPSIGLAPKLVKDIFKKIIRINKKRNIAILLVEQNARTALEKAGRGYVLDGGRKEFEDDASKILENPRIKKLYLGG